jgi:hypothetical protein
MFHVQASTIGPDHLTIHGSGDTITAGTQIAYLAADGPAQAEVLAVSICPPGVWMGPTRLHLSRECAQPLPGQTLSVLEASPQIAPLIAA